MVIVISQSGETADTCALRESQQLGHKVLGIINVVGSSIAREADNVMYYMGMVRDCRRHNEAYSAQLTALPSACHEVCQGAEKARTCVISWHDRDLKRLPAQIEMLLSNKQRLQRLQTAISGQRMYFLSAEGWTMRFLWRGRSSSSEISYIHSEAYAEGVKAWH